MQNDDKLAFESLYAWKCYAEILCVNYWPTKFSGDFHSKNCIVFKSNKLNLGVHNFVLSTTYCTGLTQQILVPHNTLL